MSGPKRQRRARGGIDTLPSGALRVRVFAGYDPLTKKRHYLTEIVKPGPGAEKEADRVRTRLLNQVDEERSPRTRATVGQLMDRYLEVLDVEETTKRGYIGYIEKHIRPQLGGLPVGRIDAEVLDSFYAGLRTCRDNCRGQIALDHRTDRPHKCHDVRHRRRSPGRPSERATREHHCGEAGCRILDCPPHRCRPLASSTIRQIHYVLSGAFSRAVRWRWVMRNPMDDAVTPPAPTPNPDPPSTQEAAQLVTEAWKDVDWGTFVWLAMVTGARRGELCALQWSDVDLDHAVLHLHQSIAQIGRQRWTKDTKTHQQRRVALDAETVTVLTEHRDRWRERMAALGGKLSPAAYVFSSTPDASAPIQPDTVTQRYGKMARGLGIDTHLHALRHYSATELISVGADIRTIAGRLGHGGGGTTTLRVYAAWVSEADQRAANLLGPRMPRRPRPTEETTDGDV
ncbi:MAG TPA: tyrosine-type recombinase/integrase [Jatrophihabitantaceae bacterium]|jgi:integrase